MLILSIDFYILTRTVFNFSYCILHFVIYVLVAVCRQILLLLLLVVVVVVVLVLLLKRIGVRTTQYERQRRPTDISHSS